jgi:hypothetical protein
MQSEVKIVRLTSEDMMNSRAALQNLMAIKLPPKTAYWMGKWIKKIQAKFNQTSHALNEKRNALIKRLGKEEMMDRGGVMVSTGRITVEPGSENMDEFNARMKELLDEQTELEVMPISIEMLGDAVVSPADMAALDWLLVG